MEYLTVFLNKFLSMEFLFGYWDTVTEICIIWMVYYMIYLLLRETVAEQVLKGVVIVSIVIMLTRGLNLSIINWILTRVLAISVMAFLIIFQSEMRRGLARLGRFGIFSGRGETLAEITKAATVLSKKKVGGLIALQRKTGLRRYIESGVEIDANVSSELINTIFSYATPLHDGGIIISDNRIEAAACLFPLTQNPEMPKSMGTRHRAAVGLSEETDAVVLVVSEETGNISVAIGGRMTRDLDPKNLQKFITGIFNPKRKEKAVFGVLRKIFKRHGE